MKKLLSIFIILIFMFTSLRVEVANYVTSKNGSIVWNGDTYGVNSKFLWNDSNRYYAGHSGFTITQLPSRLSWSYTIVYNSTNKVSNTNASHIYQPVASNILTGQSTYGTVIVVNMSSPGPMR